MNKISKYSAFFMGNPLLDISAVVDEKIIEKYSAILGDSILATEKQLPVYQDLINNYEVKYISGGSTQNTARVFVWMSEVKDSATYCGSIGKDEFGKTMEINAKKEGVNVKYLTHENLPTGTCAVLVVGKERALIANLGAANHYSLSHLKENEDLMKMAKIYYCAGFFITSSPESIFYCAEHACSENKPFMMNISAAFIPTVFKDIFIKCLPYVDYLFGNQDEFKQLSNSLNWKEEKLEQIALKLTTYEKINKKRDRCIIITQGPDPTIVASKGNVTFYEVDEVPKEKIIDTNGAGDAFVGGFLSQLILDKDIPTCVKAGNYAASVILQHSGCTFPPTPNFVRK